MSEHFYEQILLPGAKNELPFTAINMVMSLDGKVTAKGKLEPGSLGGAFDRHTMNVIRSHFDAVLSGGATVRQHPFYLGVPKEMEKKRTKKGLATQPLSIVLTGSGELDPDTPLFQTPPRPPVIFTTSAGIRNLAPVIKEKASIEILPEGGGVKELSRILRNKYRVNRLLVEGGPSVNYQFYQAQLIDQVFLTLAPRFIGAKDDIPVMLGAEVLPRPAETKLLSAVPNNNELFLHYQISW